MLVVIPTYRRTDRQRTLNALPPEWLEKTIIVCDAEDADVFSKTLNFDLGMLVERYPADQVQTIAAKRRWIIEQSQGGELGHHDKIVMLDDDLRFSVRKEAGTTKLWQADEDDLGDHLWELERTLDNYAHAGWSMRQGNNNHEDDYLENTRMCYILGYRPEVLIKECELGRIETREDMDVTLQLLRKGYENHVSTLIAADQWDGYAAAGGCTAPDRIEKSNLDAFDLQHLHAEFVSIRWKGYAASVPRVEVKCAWKKAYESYLREHPRRELGVWG